MTTGVGVTPGIDFFGALLAKIRIWSKDFTGLTQNDESGYNLVTLVGSPLGV
jgi:hypothetical protein